ncbi:hypothetical protein DN069_20800 [Streptacidiphilus pinicola]|uniref:Uncharacterized protein n=1 Tax=Streptacidiphilus pinicola TaxID=2219663 RepID=A0A2X0K362_9ACTN|nr:hypothetical protein DN069_20800 [Streptacidiphilus pinicola]
MRQNLLGTHVVSGLTIEDKGLAEEVSACRVVAGFAPYLGRVVQAACPAAGLLTCGHARRVW